MRGDYDFYVDVYNDPEADQVVDDALRELDTMYECNKCGTMVSRGDLLFTRLCPTIGCDGSFEPIGSF